MSPQDQLTLLEKEFEVAQDFEIKLEIKDKIHNLKLLISGQKAVTSSEIECVGCGS